MTNLATFDLNLLRVLDALLIEGSTVKAAQRLGLSQPAVSAALGRLRHSLDDELFFRRGQGLEATDYARSLETPLRETLERIQTLVSRPGSFDPARSTARFRISGSDYFVEMLMTQLAQRLAEIAPSVLVHLVDLVLDDHVQTLERHNVDLVMAPATPLPDWVQGQPLVRSSFRTIARKGHPRLARAGVAPGDVIPIDLFCDLGHVLYSTKGAPAAMGDAALAAVGRERRVAMTVPVFSGVYRAVANSDLIALLPTALAERVADSAGLAIYRQPMTVPPVQLISMWHRAAAASPALSWLRGEIKSLMAPFDEDV